MPANEHNVRIDLPKCDDEDCNCQKLDDTIEGTIEEVLQKFYDDTIDRDKAIMELIADQAEIIVSLYEAVQVLSATTFKSGPPGKGNRLN